jgi:hypothetical protein
MRKLAIFAAFATFAAFSAPAHAVVVDITIDPTVMYSTHPGFTTGNIPLLNPAPAMLQLGFNSIITNTTTVQHKTPFGPLLGGNYLAVLGSGGEGTSTFTLSGINDFGFTWGTVDSYNILTIDTTNGDFQINGTNILDQLLHPHPGASQVDVNIYDPLGTITSVTLQSTTNAFEAANFFEDPRGGTAPLPPALLLFGTALLGLVYFGRRAQRARL